MSITLYALLFYIIHFYACRPTALRFPAVMLVPFFLRSLMLLCEKKNCEGRGISREDGRWLKNRSIWKSKGHIMSSSELFSGL